MKNIDKKRKFIAIVALIATLIGLLSPIAMVLADEDAEQDFNKKVNEYVGDSDEFTDVIEKMEKDNESDPNPDRKTAKYIMKRLFAPGEYMNNVEYGVLSSDLDVEKEDILYDDKYACNPNAPNNLLNHNCNIPNFTTSLLQGIVSPFSDDFTNAGRTTAYAQYGFGVPNDIPGGIVPEVPGNRTHTYTALELYGYDLKLTSYNGEWDKIEVSTQARMLSNFGLIDKARLVGTSMWNSAKDGMAALIENFDINPLNWIRTRNAVFEGALAGGANTFLDTSDLNVIATNSWRRERIGSTLYNVYVLTDEEVVRETSRRFFAIFTEILNQLADDDETLGRVKDLERPPSFEYDPTKETAESKEKRDAVKVANSQELAKAKENPSYQPIISEVPEPKYYTEAEQLEQWGDDNEAILSEAISENLIDEVSEYTEFKKLKSDWEDNWEGFFAKEFDAMGDTVQNLIENTDKKVFDEYPELDPKQPISHYACADNEGSPIRKEDGTLEYLYEGNNKGSTEYVNPNCKPARAPIGGGYLGSGWTEERPIDTRHIDNVQDSKEYFGLFRRFGQKVMSLSRSLNSTIAKFTNTVVGLSFSPILNELGIDEMAVELIEGFRDTVFFPVGVLMAVLSAILILFQLLREGSAGQLIISIFTMMLVFILGGAFLLTPDATLNLVDEFPTRVDNFLANAVLVDDDGTSYCSTGDNSDGIRSAQCNVWGAMVFNPWAHIQFGTGVDNLYAKGHAGDNGNEMKNDNEDLVGEAEVNMGNGHIVNNWAIYQLEKTKAGTINSRASSEAKKLGEVDKDMYRLVDLQAGPDNGAGTDSRYFEVWSGRSSNGLIGLVTTMQSIFMSVAITGISIAKIEASFMFAVSMIFLPFMLLYGMLPKGKQRLISYLSSLVTLLLRRAVVTVMLAVLLKTLNLSYSKVDSIVTSSFMTISISLAFIMYRKEMLNLLASTESKGIMSGNVDEIKSIVKENTPKAITHRAQEAQAKVKGTVSGAAGGFMARKGYRQNISNELMKAKGELRNAEIALMAEIDEDEQIHLEDRVDKLRKNIKDQEEQAKDKSSLFNIMKEGAQESQDIIGKQTERRLRREGFSLSQIYSKGQQASIDKGAKDIRKKDNPIEHDVFVEALKRTKDGREDKYAAKLTQKEREELVNNPKIQKQIRELAAERMEKLDSGADMGNIMQSEQDKEALNNLAEEIQKSRKKAFEGFYHGHDRIKNEFKKHKPNIDDELREKEKINKDILQGRSDKGLASKIDIHRKLDENAEEIKNKRKQERKEDKKGGKQSED